MYKLIVVCALAVVASAALAADALSSGGSDKVHAQEHHWSCDPDQAIAGYFHCAPPGKPSLLDLIQGTADPASLQLRVYDAGTGRFAGTETLRRADLFTGDTSTPCQQDQGTTWAFLDLPGADYYACHRFDT